jgi:hypothetical protein
MWDVHDNVQVQDRRSDESEHAGYNTRVNLASYYVEHELFRRSVIPISRRIGLATRSVPSEEAQ